MAKEKTPEKFALLSVFDKTGIVEFASALTESGFTIISTGGTAKTLTNAGITVVPIQDITGNPESFDGRMKSISFQVASGILFDRTNKKHIQEAEDLNIKPIDIVVCNLYPFEQTISKHDVTLDEAVENIDVGGPTMIRSAAKNFKNVIVIVDPNDYRMVSNFLQRHSGKPKAHPESDKEDPGQARMAEKDFKKDLAAKALHHISIYDAIIADYLSDDIFPEEKTIPLRKLQTLRYGENPHQKAAVYMFPLTNSPFNKLEKKWGRDLSYVNITDINAGLESVRMFQDASAVIIKHNCPCGIALGKNAEEALKLAIEADPESAFGGIVVMNTKMTLTAAKEIGKFKDETRANIDIVAVPEIDDDALEFLQKVRKSMGIYSFGNIKYQISNIKYLHYKMIDGGFIAQTPDTDIDKSFKDWKIVTKIKPSKKQMDQMKIAWKFISRIKSNAIIVVDKNILMTRGIGTGQTSRIRSTKIALDQAGKLARGAILASDSFFPFDDSVKLAAKAGIACIVQQGGSINDQTSIDAANKAGISMVFTGRRAFWH